MKDNRFHLFLAEVEMQCQFIMRAARDLDLAIADARVNGWDAAGERPRAVWYAIQQLLFSSGVLSELLWGARRPADDSGPLRQALHVSDDSVLTNKMVRNHFTHVDDWIGSSTEAQQGTTVRRRIGRPLAADEQRRVLMHFDPDTGIVGFGGHELSVGALVAEAQRILERWAEVDPRSASPREGHIP